MELISVDSYIKETNLNWNPSLNPQTTFFFPGVTIQFEPNYWKKTGISKHLFILRLEEGIHSLFSF